MKIQPVLRTREYAITQHPLRLCDGKFNINQTEANMHHSQAHLNTLQRPKLLIRAARSAIGDFRWGRDLRMTKEGNESINLQQLFDTLLEEEHRLNEERVVCDATYNVRKHIRILTALMVVAAGSVSIEKAA